MSSFTLKVIAVITMVIDHVGVCFFPGQVWIRCVGRISFPVFAFLLSEGFIHTSDRKRYALRLGAFALVSEIPYDLCFHGTFFAPEYQNIFFELLCGFAMLACMEKASKNKLFLLFVPLFALVSEYLFFSYGAYGLTLIAVFYALRKSSAARAVSAAAVTLLFNGVTNFSLPGGIQLLTLNSVQLWAALSAAPVFLYNGKKGAGSCKWFFYGFYPVHLLVAFCIKLVLPALYTGG